MAKNLLTSRKVVTAKPADKEYLLADGEGLFLRVRPNDAKDWLFVYTFAGKRRKLGLGSFDSVPLLAAREEATKARESVAKMVDPQQARKAIEEELAAKQNELNSRITVRVLFERWASVDLVRRKDGGAYVRDQITRHVLPFIGDLLVEDVRKGHITGVTDRLLAAGKNRTAKVAFSLIRQMFRFAVDRDVIEFDPSASIRKAAIGGKDTERERVLSDAEIRELHRKLPDAKLVNSTEAAVWLALSTCCRIGELLAAKWSDVDIDGRVWKMPDTKNGRPHTVYLSDFAAARFYEIKEATDEKRAQDKEDGKALKPLIWVFPNRHNTGPVCPKTITKQLSDRQRQPAGGNEKAKPMSGRSKHTEALMLSGGYWSPHDLRRTGATMMVAMRVLPEVAERCLNHTEENKVKRIYQRHSYENEMQQAWALLGERLELLTSDADNILTVNFGRI